MNEEKKKKLLKEICPHRVGEWTINNSSDYKLNCVTCGTQIGAASYAPNPFGLVDLRFRARIA